LPMAFPICNSVQFNGIFLHYTDGVNGQATVCARQQKGRPLRRPQAVSVVLSESCWHRLRRASARAHVIAWVD
jgi:hypothetical protein